MSKVYIVQEPLRWDNSVGARVPARDFSDAHRFGEVVYCHPPGDPSQDPRASIEKLRAALAEFSPEDYLIMVGHPNLQAWAAALAAKLAGGKIRMLEWTGRRDGHYVPVPLAELWAA